MLHRRYHRCVKLRYRHKERYQDGWGEGRATVELGNCVVLSATAIAHDCQSSVSNPEAGSTPSGGGHDCDCNWSVHELSSLYTSTSLMLFAYLLVFDVLSSCYFILIQSRPVRQTANFVNKWPTFLFLFSWEWCTSVCGWVLVVSCKYRMCPVLLFVVLRPTLFTVQAYVSKWKRILYPRCREVLLMISLGWWF